MAPIPNSPREGGLVLFFILAYAITWLFHFSINAFNLEFTKGFTPSFILYRLGLLGPLAAALIVSIYYGGAQSAKELLRGALKWRFSIVWYLWALFLIPGMMVLTIVIANRGIPNVSEWFTFSFMIIVGQIWVVVGEEFGWRGFALPRLQARFGSLGASFILGFLWSAWHIPMFFTPGSPQYAENFLPAFLLYLGPTTFIAIVMTMLYNQTRGSILVCMLLHASLNFAAWSFKIPPGSLAIFLVLELIALIAAIVLLPKPHYGRAKQIESEG
jgi:membrane protease YdiL (CAAX protease family)